MPTDRTGESPASAGAAKRSSGIYDRIFGLIVSGEFAENARLPSEIELSRRFGASRPVIREALARLRDDGLIVSRQGSGSYVRQRPDTAVLRFVPVGSIADIQRCFEFRVGLEGAAAALAAERREVDDLAAIRDAYEALEACIRTGELGVNADARFHESIARATHNHYYVSVQVSLQPHIAFGMNLTRNLSLLRSEARLRLVQDEHAAILAAIEARDPASARAAMETHIENARRRMFEGAPARG
ncbi:MAG TPA: FadR/GntR family transcriptional regulator [Microvirga sp.]|jgi:GntR family transcriptional repressor for pyruvate dehydrogenase complex|nr:FadR/GntR family transcriptional regulator [Microvirga sp.]